MILDLASCTKEELQKMLLEVEQGYNNHLAVELSAHSSDPHEYATWEAMAHAYQENIRRIQEAIKAKA